MHCYRSPSVSCQPLASATAAPPTARPSLQHCRRAHPQQSRGMFWHQNHVFVLTFIFSTSTIETSSTKPGDPLVLTTIFTAPSGCDNGYSGLVAATDYMFKNVMNPASGVLISSCYPSQFFTSAMATSSLGPYKQLVCPSGWTTGQYNSTYVYCCPR